MYVVLQPYGFMESPVSYSSIEDVNVISRWDAGQKFCIRITVSDGSLLLQVNSNSYLLFVSMHLTWYVVIPFHLKNSQNIID